MTVLLVASIGGHLTQLHQLRPRIVPPDADVLWVTNESPQSRSLLADERVEMVPYVAPRDALTAARLVPRARRLIRQHGVTAVVSTGSAIAVPFLLAASAARGVQAIYIESATRSEGPSLTGRIVARSPGVQLYTQHEHWSDRRWQYAGSVFDGWMTELGEPRPIRRAVVSLGTMRGYSFRGLVERLVELLPADVDTLWQVGATDVSGLPIAARHDVGAAELSAAMVAADVVIGHAGTGLALTALGAGRCPLLVPRRSSRHEHVDDHQLQTAAQMASAGLAVVRELGDLDSAAIAQAAATRVAALPHPVRFDIGLTS